MAAGIKIIKINIINHNQPLFKILVVFYEHWIKAFSAFISSSIEEVEDFNHNQTHYNITLLQVIALHYSPHHTNFNFRKWIVFI